MINLAIGLTPLRTPTFYWVSQLGMLPGTLVYINAGSEIAKLETLNDILSPTLTGSFVLLGIFPLLVRKLLSIIETKRGSKNGWSRDWKTDTLFAFKQTWYHNSVKIQKKHPFTSCMWGKIVLKKVMLGLLKTIILILIISTVIILPAFIWSSLDRESYENFLLHSVSPLTQKSRNTLLQ